jgi:uncharacterized protein (UPF0333 family)
MMRRGQAAMEFLMTYGWAILVVLAAIGALAYLGVLNPSNLVQGRCSSGGDITCNDAGVTAGAANAGLVTMDITASRDIEVSDASVTTKGGSEITACSDASSGVIFAVGGTAATPASKQTVNQGERLNFVFRCAEAITDGQRMDADVTINYNLVGSSIAKTATISIQNIDATT